MIELAKLQNGELVYGTYEEVEAHADKNDTCVCLLYTSPSPRDATLSRMPSSA